MSLNNKIESSLKDLPLDKKYTVAWSGGIDSTALLLAMKRANFDVCAWHIDHAWREKSTEDDNTLKTIADKIGVKFISERLEHAMSYVNREAIARKARYAQFSVWSYEHEIDNVCLGHHKEDQAETVYMRLIKGSGIRGCKGMASENKIGDLNLIRPFLSIIKKDLKKYLESHSIRWIEDLSNKDNSILRNRIRNEVFPMMEESNLDPINMFVNIGKMSLKADGLADEILEKYSYEVIDQSAIKFKWSDWESMDNEIKKLFLQKIGKELFDPSFSFGKRHLEYASKDWSGKGSIDLTKTKLERKKNNLILRR